MQPKAFPLNWITATDITPLPASDSIWGSQLHGAVPAATLSTTLAWPFMAVNQLK
jgi:hypothetical protein